MQVDGRGELDVDGEGALLAILAGASRAAIVLRQDDTELREISGARSVRDEHDARAPSRN